MLKAFYYMFDDNKFYKKFFKFAACFMLFLYCAKFSILDTKTQIGLDWQYYIIIFVLFIIMYLIIVGYKMHLIKVFRENSQTIPIPHLNNYGKLMECGFKYSIAYGLCCLPWNIFFIVTLLAAGYSYALKYESIFLISIIAFLVSIILFILFLSLIIPAATINFTETGKFCSFYNFKRIFEIIKTSLKRYLISALLCFLISVVYNYTQSLLYTAKSMSVLNFIIQTLLCTIGLTYLTFVNSYIIAHSDKA